MAEAAGTVSSAANSAAAAAAAAAAALHGPGSKYLARARMTLHAVQCHLDEQGASKLIVDLVIKSASMPKIFAEVREVNNNL